MKPFVIRDGDTLQDIVDRYARTFPHEAAAILREAEVERKNLINASGMSRGRTHMCQGKIPQLLHLAINEIEPGFWDRPGATDAFFVLCPGLRVAPHRAMKHRKVGVA